ncbi:EF-P lysine aminoacylase EpmA [Candidatus Magnetaquicoccus inordinatus]|uniref:EF-P lysine aminoacylase EpmA n=1 Tax=Candidatus Magnetaquicoccus inordinatus TaxID=2496818 RepID=UPI00102C3E6D|nr:EF-P lysine aminoacylase EpmA [Candidatus Magnetaquicoccus inordinatus]
MESATSWQPVATWWRLQRRAELLARIRAFFQQRGVVEVETPLLLPAMAPELHQDPMVCAEGYLQGSPETAMKRLLAAGAGAIYQMGRAFRAGEVGRLHNPEFTILEWYRPGWRVAELQREVEALLLSIVALPSKGLCCSTAGEAKLLTYGEAMQRFAGVDPWDDSLTQLQQKCRESAAEGELLPLAGLERQELLDWLLLQHVEPALRAEGGMVFLTDFPPTAAAMAEIDPGPPPVAKRFELYVNGVELANGYQELRDAQELRHRFQEVNRQRQRLGKKTLPIDELFLQAMEAGLPVCAGVALGVDRLLMLAVQTESIQEVMAFPERSMAMGDTRSID